MNNQTTTIDCVSPATAADLDTLAGTLIDSQDIDDNPDDNERIFRAGAKAGIRAMCKSATSAINAFGARSLAQQAGGAPAGQHGDAQSNQAVTSGNGGGEQHPAPPQQARLIFSNRPHSSKILGEHCAGTIVDIATGVVYEVMAMPGELTCVTWDEAKRTIQAAGGDLPTPIEMSMIGKLLGRLAFQESYWVNEKVKFDGDAEESFSYFSDGVFDFSEAKDRMRARGVRRISIGDVADENLDEVEDNTVIVPAPAVPARAGTSASQYWGLAAAHASPAAPASPALPAVPASAASDISMLAEKMAKLVIMQRRACDLLEAMGSPVHVEAAGDLRSATGDLWDAVQEQVAINMMPFFLDSWMATPAGLARVLVDALRKERIKEPGEYNDAVEDCITAVVGTISAGAGGDKEIEYQKQLVELSAIAPKVPVDDAVDALTHLRSIGAEYGEKSPIGQACTLAISVINGLLPHACAGVEA